jgi:hypothetical protein
MKRRQLKIKDSLSVNRSAGTFGLAGADGSWTAIREKVGQHPALIELVRLLARRAAAELMTQSGRGLRKGRSR